MELQKAGHIAKVQCAEVMLVENCMGKSSLLKIARLEEYSSMARGVLLASWMGPFGS